MNTQTVVSILVAVVVVGAGVWWYMGTPLLPEPAQLGQEEQGTNPPNSAEGAPEGSIHNLPVPAAVAAARVQAATDAGVTSDQVLILTAYERQWSDGCLGLGGPAESCLQALVDGWEVTVQVRGETHVYRTNGDGSSVRKES